jgi:hypothetical protein
VFARAVRAIQAAKARGFRVNANCTLFHNAVPERVIAFFDHCRFSHFRHRTRAAHPPARDFATDAVSDYLLFGGNRACM